MYFISAVLSKTAVVDKLFSFSYSVCFIGPDARLKPKVLSSPVCSAYHKSDLTDIFFKENEYPPTLCGRAMVFVWSM